MTASTPPSSLELFGQQSRALKRIFIWFVSGVMQSVIYTVRSTQPGGVLVTASIGYHVLPPSLEISTSNGSPSWSSLAHQRAYVSTGSLAVL